MRELLKNREFNLLFFGRIITNAGDSIYMVAAMWLVYELGNSTFYTGIAGFLVFLPQALQFLTGPLVDQWSIRRILVGTQFLQAVLVLTIPVAEALGYLTVELVLVVIPVVAMLNQFVYPAQNAALPRIVEDDQLVAANSAFTVAYQGIDFAFNALGGALIAVVGAVSIYVLDSVTFVLAIVLFALVNIPPAEDGGDDEEFDLAAYVTDLREGVEYIKKTILTHVIVGSIIVNFTIGISMAVLPAFAQARAGSGFYGAMMGALAGGMMVGSLVSSRFEHVPFGWFAIGGFVVSSVAWFASVAASWAPATVGFFLFSWLPVGAFNVIVQAKIQSITPESLVGRVSSVTISACAAAVPVGSLVGGTAGSTWTSGRVMFAAGFGFLAIALYFVSQKQIRDLPPSMEITKENFGHDI